MRFRLKLWLFELEVESEQVSIIDVVAAMFNALQPVQQIMLVGEDEPEEP